MAWGTSAGTPHTVVYDSCVLYYPAPLRDLLVQLALAGLFRARWTALIHEEWMRSVLASRPDLSRERLERTRDLMDRSVRDCLVTGFEPLVGALHFPDPDDRHVLAAAIVGRADMILTFNLRDFPTSRLAPYSIEARHPDEFVSRLMDVDEHRVRDAVRRCRERLRNPPLTTEEHLDRLAVQGLTRAAARLRDQHGVP